MPLHRLREDSRRDRGGGGRQAVRSRSWRRPSAAPAPSTRRPSWRSATATTSTTSACPACSTPRCGSPITPAPTSRRSTLRPRSPRDGRRRGLHRGRHPRRAARRADPQGLADHDPDRRPHVVCRRRAGDRGRRDAASRRVRRSGWSRSATTCSSRSPTRSPPSPTAARWRCGEPSRQRSLGQRLHPRRAGRATCWRRAHSPCTRRSARSASSTPSSSPSRRSPCRAATATPRTMHVYSGGQGVWDDRNDIASVLGVDRDRITVELVSNGGAFGGKEDMSNQAQTALAAWLLGRPVKCTLTREESLFIHAKRHPITMEYEAGCDAEGNLTALRVRGIGDSGAYASVGMKVLERACGHACGPYRWQAIDVRDDRRPHQQPRVRRVPRIRCQPGAVRDGGCDRSARRAGRHLRMGDAQAQRDPARRHVGTRSDHGRGRRRRRGLPRRDPRRLRDGDRRRQGGRARARAQELGPRQRFPRGERRGRPVPVGHRTGRGPPRLDRDGPGRAHGRIAGRGPGARHRPRPDRRDRRHHPRVGVRTDDRVAAER